MMMMKIKAKGRMDAKRAAVDGPVNCRRLIGENVASSSMGGYNAERVQLATCIEEGG